MRFLIALAFLLLPCFASAQSTTPDTFCAPGGVYNAVFGMCKPIACAPGQLSAPLPGGGVVCAYEAPPTPPACPAGTTPYYVNSTTTQCVPVKAESACEVRVIYMPSSPGSPWVLKIPDQCDRMGAEQALAKALANLIAEDRSGN